MPGRLIAATLLLATAAAAAPKPAPAPLKLAAVPALQRDAAGNRMEALAKPAAGAGSVLCTAAPRVCIRTVMGDTETLAVIDILSGPTAARPLASLEYASSGNRTALAPWPYLVRLAGSDAVLLGFLDTASTGFSGGGGSDTTLHLLRVGRDNPGGNGREWAVREVLSLPVSAGLMIRACFSDKDRRQRRGACHDEYGYDTRLTLAPDTRRGKPRFVLETLATTYPGDVSRQRDSLSAGPLKPGDLVKRRDPACSVRRVFSATGAWDYLPDTPLPDCSDYMLP